MGLLGVLLVLMIISASLQTVRAEKQESTPTPGSLQMLDKSGKALGFCPLKHTDVQGQISGPVARVTVTQEFYNPSEDKIEAVYVFPLPQNAAVDDMTMQIGARTIRGVIKEREEARKIYEAARQQGHVAALLDQERPNIFTQSVTNIEAGATVKVMISYVESLKYEEGHYEFMFPMVVGPRYIPGDYAVGKQGGGWAPDTNQVPDASKITPPVAKPGTRSGHDISVTVKIDAGVPIRNLHSLQHKVSVDQTGKTTATVRLEVQNEIPNRDFILRYEPASARVSDALLAHRDGNGDGYFTLILQPPARPAEGDISPKEIVFVLDTSGSMSGFPVEKGKQLVRKMLTHLNPHDTFNLITFSGDTAILFPAPVYPTEANMERAEEFLASRRGSGGTEMMKAIRAALDPSDESDHVRVVCFITDGYVGNDMEIIGEVKKHPNARVFSFGIGTSVNRFLLDNMAAAGRGEVEYVTLEQKAGPAAERLFERMRNPLLTDITIEWNGLPVKEIYPALIPDVFAAKPVVLYGKYTSGANGRITIRGRQGGAPYEKEIKVELPQLNKEHDVLGSLWARQKIEHLMAEDWGGMQTGAPKDDLKQQITQLGLEHRLMTQFTSFVAVEEQTVTVGGEPKVVQVPVEMPKGVSYEDVFGPQQDGLVRTKQAIGGVNYSTAMLMTSSAQTVEVSSAPVKVDMNSSSVTTVFTNGLYGMAPEKISDAYDKQVPRDSKSKRALLERKSDKLTLATWECFWLNAGKLEVPADCDKLPKDKAHVEIVAAPVSDAFMAKLKQLGFVADANSNALVGEIPIAKLKKLAAMREVKMVKFVPVVAKR
jgi:Ca-activated chloride channel family protein